MSGLGVDVRACNLDGLSHCREPSGSYARLWPAIHQCKHVRCIDLAGVVREDVRAADDLDLVLLLRL